MTIEIRAPGARASFAPEHGGRLHQLYVEIDGNEEPLLFSPLSVAAYADEPLIGGMYPMAPWPNRIRHGNFSWRGDQVIVANGREHALHGLVLDRPWEVVARVGRVIEMSSDFGPGWPWEGRAWQRFELGPNFLAMKMEVRSARETFPAGCGWHPWFRRDMGFNTKHAEDPEDFGPVRVTVPAAQRYELLEGMATGALVDVAGEFALDGAPLGERRLDDCYTGLRESVVEINWKRLRLKMAFECAFPHVQIYTPPEAFCIEPQTCAPNAFNLDDVRCGAAVVAPGRPLSIAARWTWEVNP